MRYKKIIIVILILLLSLGILTACNANDGVPMSPEMDSGTAPDGENDSSILGNTSSRKIIYKIYYTLDVDDANVKAKEIRNLTISKGGYIESSSESVTDSCYVNMVVRIPIAEVDSFINSISVMGDVINSRTNSEDVTNQILTFEEKLAVLNSQLTRYQNMDCTGFSFSENMQVEDKIAELEGQIDFYNDKKNDLEAQVDYTTITIELQQDYIPVEEKTFGKKLKDNFVASIKSVSTLFKFLVNVVVVLLPYAAIIGVVTLIVILIRRKTGKSGKNKNKTKTNGKTEKDNNKTKTLTNSNNHNNNNKAIDNKKEEPIKTDNTENDNNKK